MVSRCDQKFFVCQVCGNMIGLIENAGVPMFCCGKEMKELVANAQEASVEKHVPSVTVTGDRIEVSVGSSTHPMTDEHSIHWVYLKTENGGQRKCLKVGDEPKAVFRVCEDTPLEVFAFCDRHGLWKTELYSPQT